MFKQFFNMAGIWLLGIVAGVAGMAALSNYVHNPRTLVAQTEVAPTGEQIKLYAEQSNCEGDARLAVYTKNGENPIRGCYKIHPSGTYLQVAWMDGDVNQFPMVIFHATGMPERHAPAATPESNPRVVPNT